MKWNKEEKSKNNKSMEIQSTETDAKSRIQIGNELILRKEDDIKLINGKLFLVNRKRVLKILK